MIQRLRSLARRGLNRLEAGLHAGRRRRAVARVGERVHARLVFICLGNICRSPFAELWARARPNVDPAGVTSAGFMKGGRSSPDAAVTAARDFGVDLSQHVSRSVGEIPDGDRLWVVMEHVHLRRLVREGIPRRDVLILGDLDPEPVERRAILDPYGKPDEVFADTYRRMVRCLTALEAARGG